MWFHSIVRFSFPAWRLNHEKLMRRPCDDNFTQLLFKTFVKSKKIRNQMNRLNDWIMTHVRTSKTAKIKWCGCRFFFNGWLYILREEFSIYNYFKGRNFRGKKFSRFSRIFGKFAKVISAKNSAKAGSRKFFHAKKIWKTVKSRNFSSFWFKTGRYH